jgi:thiol-disulfide isomerase/thioredoxin
MRKRMVERLSKWLRVSAVLLLIVSFALVQGVEGSAKLVGQKLPTQEFLDSSGDRIALQDKGVRLVYFWQTTCGPCSEMIPMLNRLYEELGLKGLDIIGIGVGETSNSVDKYRKDKGAKYFLVPDPAGKIAILFNISVTPSTYLTSRDGIVAYFKSGYLKQLDESFYKINVAKLISI